MRLTCCEFYAGLIASLGPFCFGVSVGWSSPSYYRTVRNNALGYAVSDTQFFMGTALLFLGGMLALLPSGIVSKKIGPKTSMLIGTLPGIFGWAILSFGNHVACLLVGRFLLGISIAVLFVCSRLYIVHVAQAKNRGFFGALYQLMVVFGLLWSFLLGTLLTDMQPFLLYSIIPFLLLLFFSFSIPESPVYYVSCQKLERATENLLTLRGKDKDIAPELLSLVNEHENQMDTKTTLRKTLTSRRNVKALIISFTLVTFYQTSGITGITMYISKVLQESGLPSGNQYTPIFFAAIALPFLCVALYLIDKVGRKLLLIVSAGLETFLAVVLGICFTIYENTSGPPKYAWIPITALIFYNGCFQLGMGPVPFTIAAELFPERIRFFALGIIATYFFFLMFLMASIFGLIFDLIGMGPMAFIFGLSNSLCIVFAVFFLPETSKKSLGEIQEMLDNFR